ncbi:GNAT family N-acetyltransferase [Thalassomonas haliotis]|uniref:GNAT family N-acetyltransferase n=1 Tax=Thalassomonas haliotis TaxID=485448 RepID=A0ABY7VLL2_9GAMM|nr:GNAT family N-acetyltransferase [Thalassomonas haliotis]WDE13838.1 GNAT family N-acetyltransferase [Thalassomonas haliotis]
MTSPLPEFEFCRAEKSDKKAIKRFYRQHSYSASFMGLDSCYLVKDKQDIIASVLYSQLLAENRQSLLHALVVAPDHRRLSIAASLLDYSRTFHPLSVCFAAPELAPLYLSNNFQLANLDQLSPLLARRYLQYIKAKPELAIFIRDIK